MSPKAQRTGPQIIIKSSPIRISSFRPTSLLYETDYPDSWRTRVGISRSRGSNWVMLLLLGGLSRGAEGENSASFPSPMAEITNQLPYFQQHVHPNFSKAAASSSSSLSLSSGHGREKTYPLPSLAYSILRTHYPSPGSFSEWSFSQSLVQHIRLTLADASLQLFPRSSDRRKIARRWNKRHLKSYSDPLLYLWRFLNRGMLTRRTR